MLYDNDKPCVHYSVIQAKLALLHFMYIGVETFCITDLAAHSSNEKSLV